MKLKNLLHCLHSGRPGSFKHWASTDYLTSKEPSQIQNYCVTSNTTSNQQHWKQSSLNSITVNHSCLLCRVSVNQQQHIPTGLLEVGCVSVPIQSQFCVGSVAPGEIRGEVPHSAIDGLPAKEVGSYHTRVLQGSVLLYNRCTLAIISPISHREQVLLVLHKYRSSFYSKMNPNQIIERLSNIRNYQSAASVCLYPPWVQFLSFLRKTWSFHQPLPVMCMAEFRERKDPEETNNTQGLQDEGTDLEENVGWIFLRALNFYLQWLLINRKRNPSSSNGQRQAKMFLQLG